MRAWRASRPNLSMSSRAGSSTPATFAALASTARP
jgi:hypothetical protein